MGEMVSALSFARRIVDGQYADISSLPRIHDRRRRVRGTWLYQPRVYDGPPLSQSFCSGNPWNRSECWTPEAEVGQFLHALLDNESSSIRGPTESLWRALKAVSRRVETVRVS
jgi:hypothetical protein